METFPVPFIVGTGRCGTTLLRRMLSAHPLLAIPPETHALPAVIAAPHDAVALWQGSRTWHKLRLEEDVLHRALAADPLRGMHLAYAAQEGKPRWGDKTPGYHAHMRAIAAAIPEARFIHLVRDGRDVALSVLPFFARDGRPHTPEEGAAWWLRRMKKARKEGSAVPHYCEVRYEDLVREPEATLRAICDGIELPWNKAVLRAVAPSQTSVSRWQRELSPEEQERVEAACGRVLLRRLGYALLPHRPTLATRSPAKSPRLDQSLPW